MATSVESFRLSVEAAERYEAAFVPALFAEWAPVLVDAAGVQPGQAVLDVACGTGVVAREASKRLGGAGSVVGLDLNEAMLIVARRIRPDIEWRQGDAMALPFEPATFDVVLCQAALMFVPDPEQAIREMARVVKSTGTVAIQVWASRDVQSGFKPFYEVVARHAGPDAVDLISAYWTMGDLDRLRALCASAGLTIVSAATRTGAIRLPSADLYVTTEVESTPLIDRISPEVYQQIREEARNALAAFNTDEGFQMPIVGHVLTAKRWTA
jgi:ubiquinone/menaquinone biosynthesis C-methylase UbiE